MGELEVENNGHVETETLGEMTAPETPEQLNVVFKKLSELKGQDGAIVRMSKEHSGVMSRTLSVPLGDEEYRQVLIITEFLSDDDAQDFVAVIWEDKRYGMPIGPDLDVALARCSVNRKGPRTNRVAQILEAMMHTKITTNQQQARKNSDNPSSRDLIK